MKSWLALTCPTCGFRFPLRKFALQAQPIASVVQIMQGGGRAKGFHVVEYLPWSKLPDLQHTDAWNSVLGLYNRLGAAYDPFYQVLGFLSPTIKTLIHELRKPHTNSYLTEPFADYTYPYTPAYGSPNISEAYSTTPDYPSAYDALIISHTWGGRML